MDKPFVFQEVKKIIADYPVMECDVCAIALSNWLKQNDIPYKILRLKSKPRNEFFIVAVVSL